MRTQILALLLSIVSAGCSFNITVPTGRCVAPPASKAAEYELLVTRENTVTGETLVYRITDELCIARQVTNATGTKQTVLWQSTLAPTQRDQLATFLGGMKLPFPGDRTLYQGRDDDDVATGFTMNLPSGLHVIHVLRSYHPDLAQL